MKDNFISQDGYDLCVICRQKTPYPSHTHIDFRIGYVEGVGQTCTSADCSSKNLLTVSLDVKKLKYRT